MPPQCAPDFQTVCVQLYKIILRNTSGGEFLPVMQPDSLLHMAAMKVCLYIDDYDTLYEDRTMPTSVKKYLMSMWHSHYPGHIVGKHARWPNEWTWAPENGFIKQHYLLSVNHKFTEMQKWSARKDCSIYDGEIHTLKYRFIMRIGNRPSQMQLCKVCVLRCKKIDRPGSFWIERTHTVRNNRSAIKDLVCDDSNFCQKCHQRLVVTIHSAFTCIQKIGVEAHHCECLQRSTRNACYFCWDGYCKSFVHYLGW